MALRYTLMLALLLALVAGCAKSDDNDVKGKLEDVKDKAKEPVAHVWSGQVKALDKAKGVEQTLMQSAQQQSREIDKQSQ